MVRTPLGPVDILDPDGDAVERTAVDAGGDLRLGGPSRGECFVHHAGHERADARLEHVRPLDERGGDLDRRYLLRAHPAAELGDALAREVVVAGHARSPVSR